MNKGKVPILPAFMNINNEKSIIKNPQCAVIIKDLSYFCNELHLASLVSCYGQCVKVHICRSEADNNRSLLYSFVELSSEEAVLTLIEELHAVIFMGRQLRIQRCHDHLETRDVFSNKTEKAGIQILVRFQSIDDKVNFFPLCRFLYEVTLISSLFLSLTVLSMKNCYECFSWTAEISKMLLSKDIHRYPLPLSLYLLLFLNIFSLFHF
jgi:RNA recognition motif-containing protein